MALPCARPAFPSQGLRPYNLRMDNKSIARILRDTAQLLEIDGAIIGRYRIYEKAAELIYGMHESIEELAKDAGVSRSVLAERFAELVGMPPMHYLANWRMQIASGLLSGGVNIAAVAAETGYGSEAAFSRAFKKATGLAPGTWRVARRS